MRSASILLVVSLVFSGCAATIPSRSSNAAPASGSALYSGQAAVFPFVDKRADIEKEKAKRLTWPGSRGHMEYFGKDVEAGLARFMAEYLSASRIFDGADLVPYTMNESLLMSQGYEYLLTGNIEEFRTGFSAPKWVLVIAALPIPAFGLTLAPLAVWPKEMEFEARLVNLEIKDLRSGKTEWKSSVDILKTERKTTLHCTAKWFLGETAELAAKEIIAQIQRQAGG